MVPINEAFICYTHHTFPEVANQMLSFNVSSVIVTNDRQNEALGIITKTDLLSFALSDAKFKSLKAGEMMTTKIVPVDESDHRVIVARKMVEGQFHHAIVLNGEKKLGGVISTLDIIRSLVKEADDEIEKLILSYSK